MSGDMRVRLLLDLVNRLSPGAKAAQRDLRDIKVAAAELKREKGGEALAEGLKKVTPAGRQAARDVRAVKAEAKALAGERGPQQLAGGLDKAAGSAKRLKAELAATKRVQRDFVKNSGLGGIAAETAAKKPGGEGAGGAAMIAGRGALMPLAAAYGGYRGVTAATRATVGTAVNRDKAMAEIKKKVDLPDGKQWADLEKQIAQMSISYGRKFEDISAIVAEAGASNVEYNDLPRFTKLAAKAAIGWDMDMREAAQKLFEIRSARGSTIAELEELADIMNDQEDNSAAKARDIVEMFQRAGEAGEISGVNAKAAISFLTAVRSGGMQPEIAARMFGAFVGGLRTIEDGTEKAQDAIKALGMDPKKVEKGMATDSVSTIVDLFDKLGKHKDQAKIARNLFGKEWWDDILRAKKVMPEFIRLLDRTRDPKTYSGSLEKALNVDLATTATHLAQLKELSKEVGNRLGAWALPPINDAIKRYIAAFDEMDRRIADKKRLAEVKATDEATADKLATGQPLTAEERERMAIDAGYRKRMENRASEKRTDRKHVSLNDGLRLKELETERDQLMGSIDARRRTGAGDDQLGFSIRRLTEINDSIRSIDASRAPSAPKAVDPRRPADQEDRVSGMRGEVLALRERVNQLNSRIGVLTELANTAASPADRDGFIRDRTEAMRRRHAAVNNGIGSFGLSGPVAPAGGQKGAGPGILSFGVGNRNRKAAEWAQSVRENMDIDLGPAGMTMAEKLAIGIQGGTGAVSAAAAGLGEAARSAATAADLSAAGRETGESFAAGLRSAGPSVAAAMGHLMGQARANQSTRRGLQGALHDGVD